MAFFTTKPAKKIITVNDQAVQESMALAADIEIPAPDGCDYRPYQKAGVAYAMKRKVTLIADSMRLGKTIQAIGVANKMGARRILVVCPAIAKVQWTRELKKWLVIPLTIGYCEGDNNPFCEVTVINYDIIERHFDWINRQPWDLIAFDESKALMTEKSLRTKFCFGGRIKLRTPDPVTKRKTRDIPQLRAKRVLMLDGTPIYTRPKNLFTSCKRAGLFSDWFQFGIRYCGGTRDRFGWDFDGASNLEELQLLMRSHFMVRRERSQVVDDIPPIRETVVLPKAGLSDLVEEEMSIVRRNLAQFEALVSGQLGDDATDAMLAEIAPLDGIERDGPVNAAIATLVGQMSTVRRELALRKCDMVVEHVKALLDAGEPKIILFAHHRDVVTKLHKAFPGAVKVMGGMSPKKRQGAIDTFNTDPECRLFVGNIQSAGQAINLAVADLVIFAELSWVPAEMDQAEERAWDVEKKTAVTIQRLVVEDSLDEVMVTVLDRRQKTIARALKSTHLTTKHFAQV
jgi:SWI/SNF-related matrix-associated actin-dependent regulator 1 of chromatin subfamily A